MPKLTESTKVQKLNVRDEHHKIDVITQLVDLMEKHNVTLVEMLDEYYLRRI